jgi:hypothetical protein
MFLDEIGVKFNQLSCEVNHVLGLSVISAVSFRQNEAMVSFLSLARRLDRKNVDVREEIDLIEG